MRNAVNSGKETICVYGNIDLGDISTSGCLQLKENQKLVGVGYYGDYSNGEDFSSHSATASVANKNLINITKAGNYLISDLSLNYENTTATGSSYAINVNGTNVITDLQNLDIVAKFDDSGYTKALIIGQNNSTIHINKKIKLEIAGNYSCGIYLTSNTTLEIKSNSSIDIKALNDHGTGIKTYSSICNVYPNAILDINTAGQEGHGIWPIYSSLNIYKNAKLNIKTTGNAGIALYIDNNSLADIYGNISIATSNATGISMPSAGNNLVNIGASATIYFNTKSNVISWGRANGNYTNTLEIASGAKLAFEKDGQTKWYEVQEDYYDENTTTTDNKITADNVDTILNMSGTSSWQTPSDVLAAQAQEDAQKQADFAVAEEKFIANQNLFNSTLTQYDSLISDSWYKGTNLLQGDSLKIDFNEDRSSNLLVQGEDISSSKIGLATAAWENTQDVQNSLTQILSAQNKLRETSTKLGNYYLITTERSNFTDKLIQVLEEGADKLTLADMNEESANMLALQTRQSLATNSLSLASQASQSILKLF